MIPPALRNAALQKRNATLIAKMVGGDEKSASKVLAFSQRKNEPQPSNNPGLTVCITNFKRANYLQRAIQSCSDAGIEHVVVASMMPDADVRTVIDRWQAQRPGWLVWTALDVDNGCNELWLQAAYRCTTDRLIILHDDDYLAPQFGKWYRETISPALDNGCGFASWRGHVAYDDGSIKQIEWFHGQTRVVPSSEIEKFVGTKGRLSLSPIISVFRRSVLIDALKEADQYLTHPDCLLHPGMLLGTEILAYLRHCSAFPKAFYVNEVLSYYGSHDGSGTIKAEKANNLAPLIAGYDIARDHYFAHRASPPPTRGRLLLVYSDYESTNIAERNRIRAASSTWKFHFEQGELLDFPLHDSALRRSSLDVGDQTPVPYVRDLFDYGASFASENDIIVLANRDVCLTTLAVDRIRDAMRVSGIIACPRHNMEPIPVGRLFRSVKNCKPDGGYDVFAVTPKWWRQNRDKLPDMFLGREAWDTVYRTLAYEQFGDACYLPDICYHENHVSRWITERTTLPSQVHNRKLGYEFFQKRNDPWMLRQLGP